jgi:hypothetical protein
MLLMLTLKKLNRTYILFPLKAAKLAAFFYN